MIGITLQKRYRLDAELGHGGMGAVYRGHDLLLDRDVAVKVLSKAGLGSEGRSRLLREAQAVAKLDHPNIVAVYDAGEADDVPYIVMQYVHGTNLHDFGRLSISQVVEITGQLCDALDHAHRQGVIHRDLKPENVILVPGQQSLIVKLMDFGLARSVATRLTEEGTIIGTVFYLAPEQALGKEIDGRADLYSLGVMLYELTTGRLPFIADEPLAVISQHLYAPVVPPSTFNPEIGPGLEALILDLLSKQAYERPSSAAEVRQIVASLGATISTAKEIVLPEMIPELSLLDRIARGKLVGRERELAEASVAWRKAMRGESRVLLISGEPGIGKTRLARELMAQARVQLAHVLLGECDAEGGSPYAPLTQILDEVLPGLIPTSVLAKPVPAGLETPVAQGASLATRYPTPDLQASQGLRSEVLVDLLTLAPDLRECCPDLPPNPSLDLQAEQQRVFESLVELCKTLSVRAPVLLVIDDAHWADSGTLSILRHLARRAARLRLRLLITLTYREIELDEARALNDFLYDINRERLSTRIKLSRLDRQQTRDLLEAMFADQISPDFLNEIYSETEGNPFFIEEVCKALIEDGKLYREGGRWRSDLSEAHIPQSIRVAIQARLGKLPPEIQETLRLAAILGREFDFDVLREVSELGEEELMERLEIAERAQLIYEVSRPVGLRAVIGAVKGWENWQGMARRPVANFAFTHALIPSTLHEAISGLRRQRLHLCAAQALEGLFPERLDELAQQLGRHYAEAGEWEKAADYLLRAGERSRLVYAYQDAIQSYQQALGILRELGPSELERAARTGMKLGLLYHTIFDYEHSRQVYQEAFDLWQQASDPGVYRAPRSSSTRSSSTPDSKVSQQVYRQYWSAAIDTLDPSLTNSGPAVAVIEQIFSGLVEPTPELDLIPAVARSWEVLNGGRKYIFHLRDDARWSDGRPVTAGDFEYAWKRALDPRRAYPASELLQDIKNAQAYQQGKIHDPQSLGITATDSHTLVVDLEEPSSYFLHLVSCSGTFPIPRHVVETFGDEWSKVEHIVTNGPFRLQAWEPGEKIVLTRNPDYPGFFSDGQGHRDGQEHRDGQGHRYSRKYGGNISQIELTLLDYFRPEALLDMYETGLHDIGLLQGPAMVEEARRRHADEYVATPAAYTYYVGFNTTRPPFDDLRVRRAFAHAVDRQRLADVALNGAVGPASGGFVPPGMSGHSPSIGLAYDPELARHLIAEAGFPGGRDFPPVQAWETYSDMLRLEGSYLEAQWRENLGIQIEWTPMEVEDYRRYLRSDPPDLIRMGWLADYPDPDTFLRVAAHQPYIYWHDERYEKLIEAARHTTDPAERIRIYQQADRLLIEEAPILPLHHGRHHLLVKPWVKRYPISALKTTFWKDVIIEPH